ncbi:primosomal protein N' [Solimonas sp. K1W22B-7]|uniref:primosomal protein N' n=1 Tax=Solimonas sp. K1W22B-7 TaxID=2303331 RepID=UPI000E3307E7|nr:primosomal protein N' [Solimonas sp. K1W22B-7]AXQ31490.1 primosomal protein N' [Solimonas sp. K1W22B-7]
MSLELVAVAVPVPLYKTFDYLVPARMRGRLQPGMRLKVPFGRRQLVGVALEAPREAGADTEGYRHVEELLDEEALLSREVLGLARWAADYYRHPPGEVMSALLPGPLRRGQPAQLPEDPGLRLTRSGAAALGELPSRKKNLRKLLQTLGPGPLPRSALPRGPALALALESGWIETVPATALPFALAETPPELTPEQAAALAGLQAARGFDVALLQGVTGSGKTELYLRRVAEVLERGGQALVLAPEIGLTPQLVERLVQRFGEGVAAFHSGMSEAERGKSWLRARSGAARVVVGTRSAVFLPFIRLELIVIDEEHDPSYKQQEGFRYSARDVAVLRAQRLGIPLILGSATPALESLHNAGAGRYRRIELSARVGRGAPPQVQALDLRGQLLQHGLSEPLLGKVQQHLDAGGQALLFINRRGYAPMLVCHDCGWMAACQHCDARMTLHRGRRRLVCHHCGAQQPTPSRCGGCGGSKLLPVGEGTERIEDALRNRFPMVRTERFDSDRLARKGELEKLLADIRSGDIRILVGTQILAKGHDFPGLSLVGIVSADQALYGADFRAVERMGQLVTQVAGRAGRSAGIEGDSAPTAEVLLQTHEPQHPALLRLITGGYPALAELLLAEREAAGLPPYSHLALLRAESMDAELPLRFLAAARELLAPHAADVMLSDPVPALMERRGGYVRAQLLLQSTSRAALQKVLAAGVTRLDGLPDARKVRWSVDVDPADLF